jgi:hypothetical protein
LKEHIEDSLYDFDKEDAQLEISDIQFSFNNNEILKMLRDRGHAIKHLKFNKLQKIDHKIDEYLQEGTTKEEI